MLTRTTPIKIRAFVGPLSELIKLIKEVAK